MKTSVRFLSLILAVVMIAGMAITASADNNDKIANEEALDFLVNLGVFGGYDDGSLKPNELVQRDEMAKIIFVLYTTFSEAGVATESFSDVPADNWAAGYVSWCAANGIVGGYGNGKFGPDDNVTYDQALKMVCGALGYKNWDSRFWPTDVRRTALTTLNLGDNISGVKGSDYVTRAQIAQIVYNALYADMNETRKNEGGFNIPMVLISDVWGVTETIYEVVATENLYTVGAPTEEENEIVLDVYGNATLEELGLEKYSGKTDALINTKVNIIKRGDDILGTTVKSAFEDGVKITLNKEGELCLNGEVLTEEEKNALSQLTITADGKVATSTLLVPDENLSYVATACDKDADGKFDWIEWNYYSVYEVGSVGKKSVDFIAIDISAENKTVANEKINSNVALAEDQIVVLVDRKFAVDVVSVVNPVTASVEKLGNDKITLAGVGEFAINEKVFDNAGALDLTENVMDLDENGDAKKFDFYIYDGKVFYAPDAENEATENNYAILAYINTPEDPILDAETHKFTTVYSAVLVINGKETKVALNPENTVIDAEDKVISIRTDADKLLADYGKEEHIIDYYLQPNYTLVTYTVNNKQEYTLKLVEKDTENYTVLKPGATIEISTLAEGLYKVKGNKLNGDMFTSSRVAIDETTALYYAYSKEATGLHSYLGVYTKDNIYKSFYTITTTGYTYLVKEEGSSIYVLETAMLASKLTEKKTDGGYRKDARLIKYCYSGSTQEYLIDKGGVFSSHYLMDTKTLTNSGATLDTSKKGNSAQILSSKSLYAYDEDLEEYVKITKENTDVTCLKTAIITDVINGCLVTEADEYYSLTDSSVIWTFAVSVNGDRYPSTYRQLTLDEVVACLELLEDEKEKGNDLGDMRAMFFTYKDSKGEEQISSLYVDFWSQSAYGDIFIHRDSGYNDFIGSYDSDLAIS